MRSILILTLLFVFQYSNSQIEDNSRSNISLSVVLPDNSDMLSQKSLSKLESKILRIVTKNGISGIGFTNEFLIYPKLEVYDESIVEGMRNMVVVELEFNLFIQQYSTKKIFSSYSKTLKGNGFTKEKAIANAIAEIPISNKKLEEFIASGKTKIIDYYKNNCAQIVADADYLIKVEQYRKAMAIFTSIPKEATECYTSVQNKAIEAYKAYQKKSCESNYAKAQTELAKNNYRNALNYLSYIDPSSTCSENAQKLIRETALQIDTVEKRDWNLMLKKMNDRDAITRYRLNNMKEISKAYYTSKPTQITYKSLF